MKIMTTLVGLLLVLLFTVPSYATTLIDLGTGEAGLGGTVVFSGGNAVGTGIPLGNLLVVGAPSNNGDYKVSGPASGTGLASAAALDFNTSNGTVSVVGDVPALGITSPITLLTGSISSFTINSKFGGLQLVVDLSGPDSKGAALLTALGLPTDTQFQYYASDINLVQSVDGNVEVYVANSTDISNTSVTPEPASIALFGSGLLGLSGFFRRRLRK
jgi:hypothetical protein